MSTSRTSPRLNTFIARARALSNKHPYKQPIFNRLHILVFRRLATQTFLTTSTLFTKHRGYTPKKRSPGETLRRRPETSGLRLSQHAFCAAALIPMGMHRKKAQLSATSHTGARPGCRSYGLRVNMEICCKRRKEGGQVPRSVRIQAPARQRGSVSP